MSMLAFRQYAVNEDEGISMLRHCLDPEFIMKHFDKSSGNTTFSLRRADKEFLDMHLKDHPEKINAYLKLPPDAATNSSWAIEVRQSCFCGREASYKSIKKNTEEQKELSKHESQWASTTIYRTTALHTGKHDESDSNHLIYWRLIGRIRKLRQAVFMNSSAKKGLASLMQKLASSMGYQHLLVSNSEWSVKDEEQPIIVGVRLVHGM